MAKLVSKTYGDALFELAVEENKLDLFVEEIQGVLTVLKENSELTKLMNHPKVMKEEKVKVVEKIYSGKVSEELAGLMVLLVKKGRYNEIENIFNYFIQEVKEYKNIGTAYVVSAMELSEPQKEQVKKRLIETTNYVEIEINYAVDTSLIGGMVIRIGDRVVDSSIKTRIYELSKELSKIQLVS